MLVRAGEKTGDPPFGRSGSRYILVVVLRHPAGFSPARSLALSSLSGRSARHDSLNTIHITNLEHTMKNGAFARFWALCAGILLTAGLIGCGGDGDDANG